MGHKSKKHAEAEAVARREQRRQKLVEKPHDWRDIIDDVDWKPFAVVLTIIVFIILVLLGLL